MIIDCDSCQVRGLACGDCVIGVLMGAPALGRRTSRSCRPARPSCSSTHRNNAHSPCSQIKAWCRDCDWWRRTPRRAHDDGDAGASIRDVG